ncbi:MAG TPA: protein kinase [Thermoanaerobaculia bacterium]|nr:protein kinase [Thermoanaerobaculia bacterium]
MLEPGRLLQNRYLIQGLLSKGGMGAVYEALDQRLQSVVALKETFFDAELLRNQFEREARMLARLRHPALTKVIDHFSEDGGQFLVMEFIGGPDLGAQMKERGEPFPLGDVLLWGDQLLDALDYLHTQVPPVIHRDIKPQNMKLTNRNQIILLDFGLAKDQATHLADGSTSASLFAYTPHYAPLEQVQGKGTDRRSDLYSLAASLYQMMTFVVPSDSLSRAAAVVNGEPDPLRPAGEVDPSLPAPVAAVLSKALALSPEKRPATAAEMRALLRDAIAGSNAPTLAGEPSRGGTIAYEEVPAISPHATTTAGQPTEVPTEAVDLRPTEVVEVPPTEVPAPGRASNRRTALIAGAGILVLALAVVLFVHHRSAGSQPLPAALPVSPPSGTTLAVAPAPGAASATPSGPQEGAPVLVHSGESPTAAAPDAATDASAVSDTNVSRPVGNLRGRVGDELSDGKWRFLLLDVNQVKSYTMKRTTVIDIAAYHNNAEFKNNTFAPRPGNTLFVFNCRVINAMKENQSLSHYATNTAVVTDQGESYPQSAIDIGGTVYQSQALVPGSKLEFAVLFVVPQGTKLKELVFTLSTDVHVSL